jgi:pilus assembly protein Flp/PilA
MLPLYLKIQSALQTMRDERGQDLIEYALLAALISIACITMMGKVATAISTVFSQVVSSLNAA